MRFISEVIHDKKVVGYFVYNTVCDLASCDIFTQSPDIYADDFDPDQHECNCGRPPVPVLLWTLYAEGFHWKGEACLHCGVIVQGIAYNDSIDGHPLAPKAGEGEDLKPYYFTFGCGQVHAGCYTVIRASCENAARIEMVRRFGLKWSFCYDSAEAAGVERWGLKRIN